MRPTQAAQLIKNSLLLLLILSNFSYGRADIAAPAKNLTPADSAFELWVKAVRKTKEHFALQDVYSKKVDNTGDGDAALYGVRNFRAVLNGVYYRGGANNVYNKNLKRDNQNPLQKDALANLCREDFGTALYFYTTNAESMQTSTTCEDRLKKTNVLAYRQISALDEKNQVEILKLIHDHILSLDAKPIYGHCWNGWHASGIAAALTLMQFCKWSNDKALDYWMKNTDGNNKKFTAIKKRIKTFKRIPELEIDEKYSREICPEAG